MERVLCVVFLCHETIELLHVLVVGVVLVVGDVVAEVVVVSEVVAVDVWLVVGVVTSQSWKPLEAYASVIAFSVSATASQSS